MLYSIIIFIMFLGVYLTVNTFHRFEKRHNMLTHWSYKNPWVARILGILLLLGTLLWLYSYYNFWTSFFMWLNGIILILMLIVLFNPWSRFKAYYAFVFWGFLLILEIFLSYAS